MLGHSVQVEKYSTLAEFLDIKKNTYIGSGTRHIRLYIG
jgi:hypothetical protein